MKSHVLVFLSIFIILTPVVAVLTHRFTNARQECSVERYTIIMHRATKFEHDGNLALREAIKEILNKSSVITNKDYDQLNKLGDTIELNAMREIFLKDQYKYRSSGGLTVNLPTGYVARKKEN